MKIPLDDQITSIQQVCDSRFLWLQQTMPDKLRGERTVISRIDLDEIRALEKVANEDFTALFHRAYRAILFCHLYIQNPINMLKIVEKLMV